MRVAIFLAISLCYPIKNAPQILKKAADPCKQKFLGELPFILNGYAVASLSAMLRLVVCCRQSCMCSGVLFRQNTRPFPKTKRRKTKWRSRTLQTTPTARNNQVQVALPWSYDFCFTCPWCATMWMTNSEKRTCINSRYCVTCRSWHSLLGRQPGSVNVRKSTADDVVCGFIMVTHRKTQGLRKSVTDLFENNLVHLRTCALTKNTAKTKSMRGRAGNSVL